MTLTARHIGTSIARPCREVYAFASNPENLPLWAAGLSGFIAKIDGEWVAESPMGSVKVEFVAANDLGVLDHTVTLPSGESLYNPLRVVPNAEGSEIVFTLFRQPGVTGEEFEADAAAVARDLAALKGLLES